MKITKEFTIRISEEELKHIIADYMQTKHKQSIIISHINHDTKSWTEGYGMMERDYTTSDGLTVKCTESL